MRYDYVLFDMDGTVLDTSKGIIDCVRYTLDALHLAPLPQKSLERFIGPTLWESFRVQCGLTGDELERAVATYRALYEQEAIFEAKPYDGILDLIAYLRENKVKTAIATLKVEKYMERILERFNLYPYFDAACGGTPRETGGKVHIVEQSLSALSCADKSRALLIGDSPLDAQGAEGAGIDFIAAFYGFGFQTIEEAKAHKSILIANSVSEIREFFKPCES